MTTVPARDKETGDTHIIWREGKAVTAAPGHRGQSWGLRADGGRGHPALGGLMTWKTGPEPRVPAGILATHLDRSLQLSYKLVMDALGHLRLQLVEALVIVSEPLEAGGRREGIGWIQSHQLAPGQRCPSSQGLRPCLLHDSG